MSAANSGFFSYQVILTLGRDGALEVLAASSRNATLPARRFMAQTERHILRRLRRCTDKDHKRDHPNGGHARIAKYARIGWFLRRGDAYRRPRNLIQCTDHFRPGSWALQLPTIVVQRAPLTISARAQQEAKPAWPNRRSLDSWAIARQQHAALSRRQRRAVAAAGGRAHQRRCCHRNRLTALSTGLAPSRIRPLHHDRHGGSDPTSTASCEILERHQERDGGGAHQRRSQVG